jgi:hypothetical protein
MPASVQLYAASNGTPAAEVLLAKQYPTKIGEELCQVQRARFTQLLGLAASQKKGLTAVTEPELWRALQSGGKIHGIKVSAANVV